MKEKISVAGAGLVGSLLAVLLQKRGYSVRVFERRPDMRAATVSAGKSINLAMSMRGWAGLELAGLRGEIERMAIPMYGRYIHHKDGSFAQQAYGKNREAIYSVSRGELNKKLMSLAEEAGARILFEQRISEVDPVSNTLYIEQGDAPPQAYSDHRLLIAADGAFSALRNAYTKRDRYNYSQYYIPHGYKELSIPAGEGGRFLLEKNALHIWPRKNFMLIALPNTDGSFTCTLFLPFEGPESFASLQNDEAVRAFFTEYFSDALPLMPALLQDFAHNPVSSLVTVKCEPWIYNDTSMLIGDAAHAIVPFYGQGMNAGFEDCRVLMEIMDREGDGNWARILPAYQAARKKNGDAVADLALQNFIEMRDLVADPVFLQRKKIEKELGLLYPGQFNSVYEMVSFSHQSYSYALACQKAQDKLLEKIMSESLHLDELLNDASKKTALDTWIREYSHEVERIPA